MEKYFNIAGPCNPAEHYMLPATERLPEVMRLVARRQYFAIHAARQSGKTTLLKGLVRDINASGERIALYFTVESVQAYPDLHDGIAKIVERMRTDLLGHPVFGEIARDPKSAPDAPADGFIGIKLFLSMLAKKAVKPLVVFFDEVDGLTEGTAVTFLREMALGSRRLDLCVEYRDKRYALEVKTSRNFKGDDSYRQLAGYLDKLGLAEGWMPIFDEDKSKTWDEKLYNRDVEFNGKTLHVVGL